MTSPADSITIVPDSNVAPDAVGLSDDIQNVRDNTYNLIEQLVGTLNKTTGATTYTPTVGHAHTGTDSAPIDLANASGNLGASNLNTTYSDVSTYSNSLAGNIGAIPSNYAFRTSYKGGPSLRTCIFASGVFSSIQTSYQKQASWYYVGSGQYANYYARTYYVQASPPHKFGPSEDWGMFLFLLRNISTGEVIKSFMADDPPWSPSFLPFEGLPKDHPARMYHYPHPFVEFAPFTDRVAVDEGLEIVLCDLRGMNELVTYKPMAMELARLRAQRDEWISKGMKAEDLDAIERQQRVLVEIEAEEVLSGVEQLQVAKSQLEEAITFHGWNKFVPIMDSDDLPAIKALDRRMVMKYRTMKKRLRMVERNAQRTMRKIPKWQREDRILEAIHQTTLTDRIRALAWDPALVDTELIEAERSMLPQFDRFKDFVKVLRRV